MAILPFILALLWGGYSHARESSTYDFSWLDPDKEVYVLQNRKFRKKRSAFFSGGFGKGLSGAFVDSVQFQVRTGFFFQEDYGLGFLYSKNDSDESETGKSVTLEFPFRRLVQDYRGAMLLWSPFYSKTNFFNKVFYYDIIVGLGYAELNETNNRLAVEGRNPELEDVELKHQGPLVDLEAKFFITPWLNTSINVNAVYYKDKNSDNTKDIWYNQWDLTFSIGFIL